MTAKVPYIKKLCGFLAGRKFSIAVFLVLFFLGYNMTVSGLQQCNAALTNGMPFGTYIAPPISPPSTVNNTIAPVIVSSVCPSGGNQCPEVSGWLCEPYLVSTTAAIIMGSELIYSYLTEAADELEMWVYVSMVSINTSEYIQLDWLEKSMISWWNTMWNYNLLVSFQQMTRQLNVELASQAFQLQAFADASAQIETRRDLSNHEIEDQERQPAGQMCVAATEMSAFTRTTIISRAMRRAWERKSVDVGLNEKTDPDGNPYPSATSIAGAKQQRYSDWQNIFCDANANSNIVGRTNNLDCGSNVDPNLINMDILPVKYLFNNLTINVNDRGGTSGNEGKNLELGLEYLIDNLVGLPMMDAVPLSAISSSDGAPGAEEGYLLRRSYLARYAAIRSVPDMVAGWRMPGSGPPQGSKLMAGWIKDLRESGGVPGTLLEDTNDNPGGFNTQGLILAGGISKDPSYKEIMHALSIDRFNSGKYANEMITDPGKVDLEKLDVSVLYLMQLRDYYELLERTALTLAVQVSLLADEQYPGNPNMAAPTITPGGQ